VTTQPAPAPGRSPWVRLGALALLPLVILGYRAAGRQYYEGYRVPQGYGMYHLLPQELAHYMLFAVFGGAAMALLFVAARGLPFVDRLVAASHRLSARPWLAASVASAVVLLASAGIRLSVMGSAVLTDDEHAYRFIAQTLRTGALTAPSPGQDLEFYQEQFVVLGPTMRYGKYPIGHPLLLALGQTLSLESLVVPVITALLAFPLCALALRLYDPLVSVLALGLFALSPQVWFTGSSYLSQPASALCLCVAWATLLERDAGPRALAWTAVAGASLAFGILVRPLPGLLFVLPAVAWVARRGRGRAAGLGTLLAPVAAVLVLMLWVNRQQSGAALTSGYQAFHVPQQPDASIASVMQGDPGAWAMSPVAAGVRANFWLLGWPISIALCLLAGRLRRPLLIGGAIGAEVLYRVMAPKAGVGGAGPLYLFEIVPLLCLLAAVGLARLARGDWAPLRPGRDGTAALVLAGSVVSLAMFLPPKLDDLHRMSRAQHELPRALERSGAGRALVFHEGAVPPWTGLSWAYFPRCNSPRLDDPVLFVRLVRSRGLEGNLAFWRARYPDRRPLYFGWSADHGPFLMGLEDFVRVEAQQIGRR
jgi:hypothetical protein